MCLKFKLRDFISLYLASLGNHISVTDNLVENLEHFLKKLYKHVYGVLHKRHIIFFI